jgi:hypothetical protein
LKDLKRFDDSRDLKDLKDLQRFDDSRDLKDLMIQEI